MGLGDTSEKPAIKYTPSGSNNSDNGGAVPDQARNATKAREFWISPEERCEETGSWLGCNVYTSYDSIPDLLKEAAYKLVDWIAHAQAIEELRAARETFLEVNGSNGRDLDAIASNAIARIDNFLSTVEGK